MGQLSPSSVCVRYIQIKNIAKWWKVPPVSLSWRFPRYSHWWSLAAGHKHASSQMESPAARCELFSQPLYWPPSPLSHSLRSLNLDSLNTLKTKNGSHLGWSHTVEFIPRFHYDLNKFCFVFFYNMLRIQMCPGSTIVVKGELSSGALLFLLHPSWPHAVLQDQQHCTVS